MSKLVAIGPKDAISCFAVVGAELRSAADVQDLSEHLGAAARDKKISLVLLPEEQAADCREAVSTFYEESEAVLVLLPFRSEGIDIAAEEIGKEIERAVGVNLLKTGFRSQK